MRDHRPRAGICGALLAALLAAGLGLPGAPGSLALAEETGAACILAMVEAETDARVTLETGIAELVVMADPARTEIAGIARDLQVEAARDRLARVRYLAETRPDVFAGESGEAAWLAEDEEGFAARPENAARLDRLAALSDRAREHPDRDALQSVFRGAIVRTLEFQQLMTNHNQARAAAQGAFADCRGGG